MATACEIDCDGHVTGIIGDKANVHTVIVPQGVTKIRPDVFSSTPLTSITLPTTLKGICSRAFEHCDRLTSLELPESLLSIAEMAFYGCTGLTSLTLPTNLTRLDRATFAGCTSLSSVTVPNNLSRIEDATFAGCTSLTSLKLPNGAKHIGYAAFRECGLTSLTLPSTITQISQQAFTDCTGLVSIALPHKLREVEAQAFAHCTALTSVSFRPRVPGITPAFIVWAVGNSRNRTNWQITTLGQLRNVLRRIMVTAFERRDVATLANASSVFAGCKCLKQYDVTPSTS